MKPLISIIAPCYNHSAYIHNCLKSIEAQCDHRMELIFIDDCSTDDSVQVAKHLLYNEGIETKVFEKITVVENKVNKGAHNTINAGLALSEGDFISIINTDDEYCRGRFDNMLALIESTSSDLVFSGVSCIDTHSEDVVSADMYFENSLLPLLPGKLTIDFFNRNPAITTGNFFFRRSLLSTGLSFRPLRYCHDWDFLLSAFLFGRVYWSNEKLYKYRIHEQNSFKKLSHLADIETLAVLGNFTYNLYQLNCFAKLFGSYYQWESTYASSYNLQRSIVVNSSTFCPPCSLASITDA